MGLTIAVSGPDAAGELRSLHAWLAGEEELRGLARLDSAGPQPGTLGPAVDILAVALGPGGLAAALATGVVTWLRYRTADVTVTVRGGDGRELQLSAKRVRGMSPEQLSQLTARLAGDLDALAGAPSTRSPVPGLPGAEGS